MEEKKKASINEKVKKEAKAFQKHFARKTLNLMTSGFGLVAALAWNEVIKQTVEVYIKPFFGKGSGIISLLIYAVFITALAVLVTYQLSKLAEEK